jgi:predicted ferric reductase
VIVWIWVGNDNLNFSFAPSLTAAVLARFGALAGLLGAYLALIQVLLLARLPWLDRVAGFDRLTVWHRRNSYACLALVLAHTVMVVWGYAIDGKRSFFEEFGKMLAAGLFPGMVTATIGTVLFVVVTVSSLLIVRRHLSYELWYAVHLTAYAAIALAWFHEIPTGGELALNPGARAGQFFLWRFLAGGFWWTAHPFSLSAAPDGRRLRISLKASGDHTGRIATIPVGTRVVAEGPSASSPTPRGAGARCSRSRAGSASPRCGRSPSRWPATSSSCTASSPSAIWSSATSSPSSRPGAS